MFMRGLFSFCPSCYQQMQQAKIPSTQLAYTKDRHTHTPHTISDHHWLRVTDRFATSKNASTPL